MTVPVAVLGSGNIGTDLMFKILRQSSSLRMAAMAGIDPASEGLARARRLGIPTTTSGAEGLIGLPGAEEIEIVFDATSARAHLHNAAVLSPHGKTLIDLTPAALGPYVVPSVNLDQLDVQNLNMVTCGGQATIPVVAAVNAVAPVAYAEIVATIASRSAGPGTRANIDEFTETTARAIEQVGGARRGKAIIILNPAEPPMIMRDTVHCLCPGGEAEAISASVEAAVSAVRDYVPGYRLKQAVQFERVDGPRHVPALGGSFTGFQVSVFLEVSGAGHFLPEYAGNLDIMTSAAVRTAERLVELRRKAAAR
ncbi:acetaldehyde dehydrogenase (acetylating) [Streptomyces platensis]|uniref:acetaldehyde dehydrogenase (acetylating) n=1 Tax=Streptomyces platensis TaxID=58346 RepID=UPI0037BC1F41